MEDRLTYLSIIIPVYNEEENIPLLHERLSHVMDEQRFSYEIIYVDDGSKDDTFEQLQLLTIRDHHVRVVRLRRNFGQTAAMAAGVEHSSGQVLLFMDGDLQNDPLDIPRLLTKLNEGYDVVSGWRKNRQDATISRKIPSMIANRLISRITGVYLHDYGCTLKAYRWEVFQHVHLYGEMHRFLPAYASLAGASIAELEVDHHPRQFGVSKYGISRTVRVILDLLTLKFLSSYGTKPLYAFGIPGLASLFIGVLLAVGLLGQNLFVSQHGGRGLPVWPVLFATFGLQCIFSGLSAEMLMRTYYESQNKAVYIVRQVLPVQPQATAETNDSLIALYSHKA